MTLKLKLLGLIACTALLGVSQAKATTYNVDIVDSLLSISGTITTDGTIGTLNTANIADWNLKVTDEYPSFVLTGPVSGPNSSVYVQLNDLTASSTILSFSFSADNGSLVKFYTATQALELYDAGVYGGVRGGYLVCGAFGCANSYSVIASSDIVGTVAATPLPAALPLFATGLAVTGLLGWRKKRKAAAALAAA